MILLLDTTVLIDILRNRKDRRRLVFGLANRGDHLTTSAINVGEVYGGMVASEEQVTEALLSNLEIYPVTAQLAKNAGLLQFAWARKGRTLGLADTLVAATALEYGLTVMTDNRRDFPMEGLHFFALS
jgi:predicted nucleic acid-binding protein